LQAQREGAAEKGQIGRLKIFDPLLARLDSELSTAPVGMAIVRTVEAKRILLRK
jgi:hypothetical protein